VVGVEEVGRQRKMLLMVQAVLGVAHLMVAGAEVELAVAAAKGACAEHRDLLQIALGWPLKQMRGHKTQGVRRRALLL
jgi:hypothetical protein